MRSVSIVVLLFIVAGCSNREHELSFTKQNIRIIGDSVETSKEMLGDIRGFAVSNKQEVYVIDRSYAHIKMFSKEGKLVEIYGKGRGDGPGEFLGPDVIDVDYEGGVYVMDLQKRTVTVFNPEGDVRKIIKLPFMGDNIVAAKLGVFYLTGIPFTYKGNLIYKYDLNMNKEDDSPVVKFCERYDTGNNEAWAHNFARIGLEKDNSGNIYYSPPYPYEIRKFNENGMLLQTYKRDVENFNPPYYKMMNGEKVTMCDNYLFDPVFINENIIAYRVIQNEFKKQYYDFYNLTSNEYIGTINSEDLGTDKSFQIKGDRNGNIYYAMAHPYPHIVKMAITVKE